MQESASNKDEYKIEHLVNFPNGSYIDFSVANGKQCVKHQYKSPLVL